MSLGVSPISVVVFVPRKTGTFRSTLRTPCNTPSSSYGPGPRKPLIKPFQGNTIPAHLKRRAGTVVCTGVELVGEADREASGAHPRGPAGGGAQAPGGAVGHPHRPGAPRPPQRGPSGSPGIGGQGDLEMNERLCLRCGARTVLTVKYPTTTTTPDTASIRESSNYYPEARTP